MASQSVLDLGADTFAFCFRGERGVEASDLGIFLQRAATVARREGAEIRITAFEHGSLAVVLQAIKQSPVSRAIRGEFKRTPIQATAASAVLVTAVVTALAKAMSPASGKAEPLAKAGAEIVEQQQVEQIEIITLNQTIVVMDRERAAKVREMNRRRKRPRLLPENDVRALMESGRTGNLTGLAVDVAGDLHFRPDGYRYLVPVDMRTSEAAEKLFPGERFKITADLMTLDGQPDTIVVHGAVRIP